MCLPHEVLGECGANPTNRGINELEVSSINWTSKENANIISDLKGDIIIKGSYKIWNKFITWLRLKKVKVMQDFKEEFQWKWQHNEKDDALHVKKKIGNIKSMSKIKATKDGKCRFIKALKKC